MNESTRRLWGIFLAAVSIFIWGITFVCTKYLLNDFSSLEILFYRFIAAYIGLWLIRPKFEKIDRRDNMLFALAGLSGVVLYQLTENIAIHFTNASNVSVIVSICPLFTAIISQIFLKEKHITLWFITGFVISILGVVFVCFNGNIIGKTSSIKFNPKGDILALLSGICWGFYSMFISILNKRKYDSVCATRRIFFFAVLMMIPLSTAGWALTSHAAASSQTEQSGFIQSLYFNVDWNVNVLRFSKFLNWFNILFLGVLASGVCFATWNKACEIVGTVKVSCFIYLIPIVTAVFAFFALGEKITLLGSMGTIITIVGLFISEKKSL